MLYIIRLAWSKSIILVKGMSEQFLDTSGNSNPLIIKFEGIDYSVRKNCKFMGLSLTFLGIYDPLVIPQLWIDSGLFLLSE